MRTWFRLPLRNAYPPKLLREDWLYTGDLATTGDGYVGVACRKKDMISAEESCIDPDEVDGVLMAPPDIHEAATVGVPDERRGETVKSFIVSRPGKAFLLEEIDECCNKILAAYRVPRQVELLDELSRSTVMNVPRRELARAAGESS